MCDGPRIGSSILGPCFKAAERTLEDQLQTELNDPRIPGARYDAKLVVADPLVRRSPVGMVREIEKLRPELHVDALGDRDSLANSEVDADCTGTRNDAAACRSVTHRRLQHQAACVEESVDRLLASRQVRIADEVRPQGLIGAHRAGVALNLRRHRQSRLQRHDDIRRPAAEQRFGDTS